MSEATKDRRRFWLLAGIGLVLVIGMGVAMWGMFGGMGSAPKRVEVVETPGMRDRRALSEACTKGDLATVKRLIEADKSLVTARDVDGESTALHIAAWNGKRDVAALLVDAGADQAVRDGRHNGTPINWAVVAGQRTTVELLIARGSKLAPQMLDIAIAGSKGQLAAFSPTKDKQEYVKLIDLLRARGLKDPAPGHDSPNEDETLFSEALHDPTRWEQALKTEQVKIEGPDWPAETKKKLSAQDNLVLKMVPMGGSFGRNEQGLSVGDARHEHGLITATEYTTPLRIEVEARVENKNLRIYFARGFSYLNWEEAPDMLRLADPKTGEQWGVKGKGGVTKGQFVDVVWEIGTGSMRVLVDGKERATATGDFSGVKGRVGLGSAWGNAIVVRKVKVD